MECEQVRREHAEKPIGPCCVSCHEDAEMGYGQDLWGEIDGKDRHVCCAVLRAFSRRATATRPATSATVAGL